MILAGTGPLWRVGVALLVGVAGTSCVPGADRRESDDSGSAVDVPLIKAAFRGAAPRVDTADGLIIPAREKDYLYWVVGAGVLSDGSVAVGNRGSTEVLIFGPDGALIRRFGGRGGGPGEFSALSRMQVRPPDTLVVWDRERADVTRLMPDGTVASATSDRALERSPGGMSQWVATPDGLLFAKQADRGSRFPPEGVVRPQRPLIRIGAETIDTLALLPGPEFVFLDMGSSVKEQATTLFFADWHLAGGGRPWRLVVGDGASARLDVRDASGRLIRVVTWDAEPPVLTATAVTAARDDRMREMVSIGRRPEAEAARLVRQLPAPEHAPLFRRLFVDDLGNIWVKRHAAPSVPEGSWNVIYSSGTWIADVRLPADLIPLQITEDRLVGLRRDSLDVETVALYAVSWLPKASRPGTDQRMAEDTLRPSPR